MISYLFPISIETVQLLDCLRGGDAPQADLSREDDSNERSLYDGQNI